MFDTFTVRIVHHDCRCTEEDRPSVEAADGNRVDYWRREVVDTAVVDTVASEVRHGSDRSHTHDDDAGGGGDGGYRRTMHPSRSDRPQPCDYDCVAPDPDLRRSLLSPWRLSLA